MLRGRSFGSSLPVATAGSRDSIAPSIGDGSQRRGTKRTQESRGEVSESTTSGSVTKSTAFGSLNRRTSKGPVKLVIIADGELLCDLKVIVGSIWRAST